MNNKLFKVKKNFLKIKYKKNIYITKYRINK